MAKYFKNILPIAMISILPTLLIWLPFFFKIPKFWNIPLPQSGMGVIVSNYDGPLYLIVAKTLYDKTQISSNYQFPLPLEYYPAHFPVFPLLIKTLGTVMNFPYAMLTITLTTSVLALYFFNKLLKIYVSEKRALFLTLLFAVLPARFLIVRSVGSPEPLFLAAVIASIFYFKNKNYWAAGFWGAIAQGTKSPGIILFASFVLYLLIFGFKNKAEAIKKAYPILLIPLTLIIVFAFYANRTGDFFAYFHSGDNIHLLFPPFQIFNYSSPWVGTFWLEEVIFVYIFGVLGILKLIEKKEYELASFVGMFFLSIISVSHRDLIRYALPMVPFLFVAFSDNLVKKEFKIVLSVLIVPIFLFSLAFISQNVMPISNWGPFL